MVRQERYGAHEGFSPRTCLPKDSTQHLFIDTYQCCNETAHLLYHTANGCQRLTERQPLPPLDVHFQASRLLMVATVDTSAQTTLLTCASMT
jgi:hypothetical protein